MASAAAAVPPLLPLSVPASNFHILYPPLILAEFIVPVKKGTL